MVSLIAQNIHIATSKAKVAEIDNKEAAVYNFDEEVIHGPAVKNLKKRILK